MIPKASKLKWHQIDKFGMPPREIRTQANGLESYFFVKTDTALRSSTVFSDGSGWADIDACEQALAWAWEE